MAAEATVKLRLNDTTLSLTGATLIHYDAVYVDDTGEVHTLTDRTKQIPQSSLGNPASINNAVIVDAKSQLDISEGTRITMYGGAVSQATA